MSYAFLSVPLKDGVSKDKEFEKLSKQIPSIDASVFNIPDLRVGTLDNLMNMSDELAKQDSQVESVLSKLLKTLSDMEKGELLLTVEDSSRKAVLPSVYLKNFKWDEAQCPKHKPLTEHVELLFGKAVHVDEELRVKLSDLSQTKTSLDSISRKEQGNLNVRTLNGIVKAEHVVESDFITTIFVAVPRNNWKEWEKVYPTLAEWVVPESSTRIAEDNDFGLYNVMVFRKIAEDFANACREKKFVVRDFTFDPSMATESETQKKELEERMSSHKADIIRLCKSGFGDVFSSWVHIKAIRVFVESVLRYGVPPRFCATFIKLKKAETKVHREILGAYPELDVSPESVVVGSSKAKINTEELSLLGASAEYYPYVWMPINLSYPGITM